MADQRDAEPAAGRNGRGFPTVAAVPLGMAFHFGFRKAQRLVRAADMGGESVGLQLAAAEGGVFPGE